MRVGGVGLEISERGGSQFGIDIDQKYGNVAGAN